MDNSKHSAGGSARARSTNVTINETRSRKRRQGTFEDLKQQVEDLPDVILQALLSRVEQPPTTRPYLLQAQVYSLSAQIVEEYPMLIDLVAKLQTQKEEAQRQIAQLMEQIRQSRVPRYSYNT